MLKVKYSKQAEIDLENAILYIAQDSLDRADEYLARYERKIELLQHSPFMGQECKNKFIDIDCRVIVHESHLVVYRIEPMLEGILIIRIFHKSEDYSKYFANKGAI